MPGYTDIEYIQELIAKYLRVELTESENESLQHWISASPDNKLKFEELTNTDQLFQKITLYQQAGKDRDTAWQQIEDKLYVRQRRASLRRLRIYAVAASVVLVAGIVGYWWVMRQGGKKVVSDVVVNKVRQQDANPGQFHAKLILSDGSSIVLDTAVNGQLAQQGGTSVISSNGKLVYRQKGKTNEELYNTLTTAKGEMYATVLADGSKIWLNSESSIRYPVAFSGNTREIETMGECYCEIAKDASRPFIVKVGAMRVEVLGTHFNINSYNNEDVIKTTLLEGRVKISEGNSLEVLMPGQQAQLQKSSGKLQTSSDVDLEQVVAWKNGYFQFNKDDLQTVMRQISRWYDLDVVYEGAIPKIPFWGELPRNAKASAVLNALEKTGVHFRIDGKKVIVTP